MLVTEPGDNEGLNPGADPVELEEDRNNQERDSKGEVAVCGGAPMDLVVGGSDQDTPAEMVVDGPGRNNEVNKHPQGTPIEGVRKFHAGCRRLPGEYLSKNKVMNCRLEHENVKSLSRVIVRTER